MNDVNQENKEHTKKITKKRFDDKKIIERNNHKAPAPLDFRELKDEISKTSITSPKKKNNFNHSAYGGNYELMLLAMTHQGIMHSSLYPFDIKHELSWSFTENGNAPSIKINWSNSVQDIDSVKIEVNKSWYRKVALINLNKQAPNYTFYLDLGLVEKKFHTIEGKVTTIYSRSALVCEIDIGTKGINQRNCFIAYSMNNGDYYDIDSDELFYGDCIESAIQNFRDKVRLNSRYRTTKNISRSTSCF